MKTIIAIVGALVAVKAQDLSSLPECGKVCVGNMLAQAPQLNCAANDVACLCKNVNFGYGVRDCSYQSCPNTDDAARVVSFGVQFCAGVGVVVTIPATGTATVTTPAATATVTEGGASSDVGAATPVATSTIQSVITSGGSTFTTSIVTTILGVGGVPGATSIPVTAVTTEPVVTVIVSEGSSITSTIGSTTLFSSLTGSAASSILSSQASAASSRVADASSRIASFSSSVLGALTSTTASGFAAQKTAAPAGFLAAAGIAALLL